MNFRLLVCSVLLGAGLLSGCSPPPTVAVIVRHAEKQNIDEDGLDKKNPPLSEQGRQRAATLKERYQLLDIAAIYSTDFERTRQTVAPLADALGLPVTIYSSTAGLVDDINTNYQSETVLIAGHSNTVGEIVIEFGAELPRSFSHPVDEDDYDNLLVVMINDDGTASATHTIYGAPSPSP